MAATPGLLFPALLLLLFSQFSQPHPLQTYIVHLHPPTASLSGSHYQWHLSFLRRSISPDPSSRLLYSYRSAVTGFAARLSDPELQFLQSLHGVASVKPDQRLRIHTTYSYKFLGLDSYTNQGVAVFGNGTIIGLLDTGIWPESPSFNDSLMPPPPQKWRGVCQEGEAFTSVNCNRKIIGARFFNRGHQAATVSNRVVEYQSPRDSHGHGTHTSSTAGGAPVSMASVLGNGVGTARGMAPSAHIAMYKVCWFNGCYSSDILAAMDVAIRDGVDVLSLSLGGIPTPLYDDNIAIGSFRAMEHGISVTCAAGNNGPFRGSIANEAPWITTVAASTLDRRFPAMVRMANKEVLYGESVYPGKHILGAERELDLVYIVGTGNGSEYCIQGSLPRAQVAGKMVVCDRGINGRAEKGEAVKEAGGTAMILANTEINLDEDSIDAHVLPATSIGYTEAVQLKAFMNSTSKPRARIMFGGTLIGRSRAPTVAQFSSRGPSLTNPSILKPDMIAPGVNIIAAWPQNLGPSSLPQDPRRVNFSIMSGTSMACPHVSGITALIHSAHPGWSPAAVKSAVMTTTDTTDHFGKPIMDGNKTAGVFAMGAGHINPGRAINPGLVYDISPDEYVTHLCTLGYTVSEVFTITQRNVSCRDILKKNRGFSLNYPSISIILKHGAARRMIRRRLTNVGNSNSIYSVRVLAPEGVRVRVRPTKLKFSSINQQLSYRVWFMVRRTERRERVGFAEGQLVWVNSADSSYRVRSPVAVTWEDK